jgi:transcriptional regulator with XRE-family HTH domain
MPSSPNTDTALGATIRRIREEKHLSMEALAYKSGVTLNTITRLELAQSEPGWMTVRKVAAALDLNLAELGKAIEAGERPSRSR